MTRPSMVTLTLREEDARWLVKHLDVFIERWRSEAEGAIIRAGRVKAEVTHALAECDCGGRVDAK